MPPPVRAQHPTGFNALEWIETDDGSRTLLNTGLNETYHSGCGAVAETLIVYLLHSGILRQLRSGIPSVVVEYGLGTATGLLLTAALAEYHAVPLTYYAMEHALLPGSLLGQLRLDQAVGQCIDRGNARPARGTDPELRPEEFCGLPTLIDALQHAFKSDLEKPATGRGFTTAHWQLSEFVQLRLLLGDIRHLNEGSTPDIAAGICDAIYFDPFSPETNPDLWTSTVFCRASELLRPGGKLTSYCVKSVVRRALQTCGLHVEKMPGPLGGKREVLCAVKG